KFDGKADEEFSVGYSGINLILVQVYKNILMHVQQGKEIFNNMCFFPYGLLDPKILRTLMLILPLKLRSLCLKFLFLQAVVPRQRNIMTRLNERLKERFMSNYQHELQNLSEEFEEFSSDNTNEVTAASTPVTAVEPNSTNSTNTFSAAGPSNNAVTLEDITYLDDKEYVGAEADFFNLETNIIVSPILTTRVYKDHPVSQIIGDLSSAPLTRSMTQMVKDQGGLTQINNENFHTCMFACFFSQEEPKRVHQALKDPSWIEAMQEELFQFKMQKVWVLVDFPKGKRVIGLKWVFRNKKDERGIVVRNKARLVAQRHTQEKDIDYEEVFSTVARIEAIRNSGLHQAPRAWYETLANYLLENDLCKAFEKLMKDKFQMSSMGELTFFLRLQVKQKEDGIFISKDKYVAKILRKFGLTYGKSVSTPIDTKKLFLKDPDGDDADVHTYMSMIGSLINYAGASLDRKSITGGYQFLGCRLIYWQCKKQTIVATLSTKAEYVAAASCCAQVLWIQNELLDYGLTMQVTQSSMKLLKWILYVLSDGYITTPQMVLNSPCITHIKN
nr:hypothetical protein [Tanacetum cinerariifolium]